MQREKITKSGRLLEADFYPILSDGRRVPSRAPKTKPSTAEQARYNRKQAVKNFVRLVNANFETDDVYMHPTYCPGNAPYTIEDAKRDIVNYLRRVKTRRAAELKRVTALLAKNPEDPERQAQKRRLEEPYRYAYRIEEEIYKRGEKRGQSNFHFHLFMTGGVPLSALEELWPLGVRVNANRYQPEVFGPEAAALYTVKEGQGALKLGYSKNLNRPVSPKPRDGKISARGVAQLAKLHSDDAAYWEKRYKGYTFLRCYSRYNEHNGYWYVTAVMYKKEGTRDLPPWSIDDWLDEGGC